MTLLDHIRAHRLKPSEVMNKLQDNGIVSDNCVTVADVCEEDARRAVEWLQFPEEPVRLRPGPQNPRKAGLGTALKNVAGPVVFGEHAGILL